MRTVLVTGASGAIGSSLVPLLLEKSGTRVRMLLRARDDRHLSERVEELCGYWRPQLGGRLHRERLTAFRGDVTRPGLGVDAGDLASLRREVTHFVHSAGNVKFNQSLEDARRSAVGALRNVVEFCREARHLRKLDYLSTVGVAGRLGGLIPEEPLLRPREFHNTYEAAKAEAEELLLAEMGRGLPATLHRPSMVVGDSRTGRIIRFQVFYYLAEFLSGRRTNGIIPHTGEHRLDIVPADYVARAIRLSLEHSDSTGKILHLCSGPEKSPKLDDLSGMIRAIMGSHGLRLPRLRRMSSSWFGRLTATVGRLAPGRTGRTLRSLPHLLTYLEEKQHFDNACTRAYLGTLGLKLPPCATYLETVLDHYCQEKRSQRARSASSWFRPSPACAVQRAKESHVR